ncbi:lysozyme C, milk isozyme-like [Culicoides brevitarsis]|uniref:lysozyme C, milk isozyme-like n=1 Tax=Culicoides brevitarsis TaxID=469753 RepID=UPI00307C629E
MFKLLITFCGIFIGTSQAKYYATSCELMQDIVNVSDASLHEAAKWSCIGQLSTTYNENGFLGVFGIGSEWWCSPNGGGICNVKCSDLLDDDIADDFRCAKRVFTGFSNSFDAWPSAAYCVKNEINEKVKNCKIQRRNSGSNSVHHRNHEDNESSANDYSAENPPPENEDD